MIQRRKNYDIFNFMLNGLGRFDLLSTFIMVINMYWSDSFEAVKCPSRKRQRQGIMQRVVFSGRAPA